MDPMTAEETIENMIATYPMLFWSRTHALEHLLIVLGCGYGWEDGKLVENSPVEAPDRIPRDAARILAKHNTPLEDAYPYCDMCNLAKMPEDVTPEWKSVCEEFRNRFPEACVESNPEKDTHVQKLKRLAWRSIPSIS